MKHPRNETLQDYFENALNKIQEGVVKDHLMDCDRCTGMLSQIGQIENKLRNHLPLKVSAKMKNKIFFDAELLLAEKRSTIKEKEAQLLVLSNFIEEWKEIIFPEIKLPTMQVYSVSLVLAVVIIFAQTENEEKIFFKPLSTEVSVVTSNLEN